MPPAPDRSEVFVLHQPFAQVFETISDRLNCYVGYLSQRSIPIVIKPFLQATSGNTVLTDPQTRAIRFTTSRAGRFLFVALGYSAIHSGADAGDPAYVKVSVREAHATVPGSGAIIDPGCFWYNTSGDLINPVQQREYRPDGLQWSHSGFVAPVVVDAGGDPSPTPRMLYLEHSTDVDIVVQWNMMCLNAITITEAYRQQL